MLKKTSFPIVGIGGSAGGLEAFQELLKNVSNKPGAALVFIMHLAPGHKSLLPELLARTTKMPVLEITSGMIPKINHVYVKPPNTNLVLAGGKLILSAPQGEDAGRKPIDSFFHSLAEGLGNRSVGIILSGTATDGTLGAEAIKAEGGIVFAQDQKSVKFGDMPQSAISAGCVDFVLTPKKIAVELMRIARHPFLTSVTPIRIDEPIVVEGKGFEGIFDILRRAKGLDFTYYKAATISRRISRRMVLLKQDSFKDYIKFLRGNKDEVGRLYEDLLLNVTSFFRDKKVFDALEKSVIPAILKNKTKNQGIRVWVPGCSSGEEAYSIAMIFHEALGRKAGVVPVQIFATDVSDNGIIKARRGIYGPGIKDDVTPARLKRFFTKKDNNYEISKSLREMCVFSKQNVFSDPPFSNLDLISCRNLLIYFQSVLQKKVFRNFHYGLRPGGFLVLGSSESAGGYSDIFKDMDRKRKIFVKKYVPIGPGLELGQKHYPLKKLEVKEEPDIKTGKEIDILGLADRIVLNELAPCGVLIDDNMKVVQFRGKTGRFLESAAGRPSHDIFKLAREGLLMPLRSAIYDARKTKHAVKRKADNVSCNGRKVSVAITVVPVKSGPLKEEFFLVLFDETFRSAGPKDLSLKGMAVKKDGYIKGLEKELAETKEYLQTVIEEQGNVNEEVKTANEEILSSNEELQSSNEELETAKEELQSSNEELTTTNEELQGRTAEISLLNNDLINLLSSVNIPIVMLDTAMVIRRITPQADKVLNITPSDVGRPIDRIKLNLDIPDLEKTLSDVMESFHPKTFEIKDKKENWFSVYIRPYRTMDNKIDGAVAIFIDITASKKSQQLIREARNYAENIVETVREPLIVLSADLRVISANKAFYRIFKVDHKETEDRFIYDLGNRQWNIPKLRQLLEDILPKKSSFDDYEIEHNFETVGRKIMLLNARRVEAAQMILLAIEDVTEQRAAGVKREHLLEQLATSSEVKSKFASMVSHELRSPLGAIKEGINLVLEGMEGDINDKQKHVLTIAKNNTDRLSRMINNVLDFQKMESGKMEFDVQEGDINAVALEVGKAMGKLAKEKGLDLVVELDDGLPKIRFDRDKIVQVFTNLLNNAIKFTEKGRILVCIKKEDNVVHVTVKDDGPGISSEDLKRLFQPFEQLNGVRDKKKGGTGLGLVISKEIVLAHKGKIWAESPPVGLPAEGGRAGELGKGTAFHFVLPIKERRGKHGEEDINC